MEIINNFDFRTFMSRLFLINSHRENAGFYGMVLDEKFSYLIELGTLFMRILPV